MKSYPHAIYRMQLSEDFPLKKATELLPYLAELGVEGVYCSPYFAAHSTHGYDIVDPNRINPLVASQEEYEEFCRQVHRHGLVHIADLVPNHMGIKGDNAWYQDVLEKGKGSPYSDFFAIDWDKEKLIIPILGSHYDEALANGEIQIVREENRLYVTYGEDCFPLDPHTYHAKTRYKKPEEVDELLQKQHFALTHWRNSAKEINYRRFFNINELIGIRIEEEKVLQAHHKWVFSLLKQGKIDGLRIDHPDGLYDPKEYLDQIRKHCNGVIVVEKILGWDEELPQDWPVEGTVGYEYMNRLGGLFCQEELTHIYEEFIGEKRDFVQLLYRNKMFYMKTEMAADVENLAKRLHNFSSKMIPYRDLPLGHIEDALYELFAHFPVYRSYIRPMGKVPSRDLPYLKGAIEEAKKRELEPLAFTLLEELLFLKIDCPYIRDWIMRFQQLSAPIMAKGFEDITLYQYNHLIALNEVGSEPERCGTKIQEYHAFCQRKLAKWPLGFLGLSTHDTKRSMDVRMQQMVLSEQPERWKKALHRFAKLNSSHKTEIEGQLYPDRDMEYFLYQTLLGVWPSKPSIERIYLAMQKSAKEARKHTSWRHPNLPYEKALEQFIRAILKKDSPFLKAFQPFQKDLEPYGLLNSLSATVLQMGSPGIVDIYQGCESFCYTLVDPDNRTPIDYDSLEKFGIKTDLHKHLLAFRKTHKELFLVGEYLPLKVSGSQRDHLIAFLRTHKKKHCLIIATRFFSRLAEWGNTAIHLPHALGQGEEILTGKQYTLGKQIQATEILSKVPFFFFSV